MEEPPFADGLSEDSSRITVFVKNPLNPQEKLAVKSAPIFLLIHHQKSHHLVHVLREQVVAHFLIDLRVRPPNDN